MLAMHRSHHGQASGFCPILPLYIGDPNLRWAKSLNIPFYDKLADIIKKIKDTWWFNIFTFNPFAFTNIKELKDRTYCQGGTLTYQQ